VPEEYSDAANEISTPEGNNLGINPDNTGTEIGRAATAKAKFGSVTQSSNIDADGITTDSATGTFDGEHILITVTQADGTSFEYGTENNTPYIHEPFAAADLDRWAPATHDQGQRFYHARSSEDSYHADYIAVSSDSADPTADYLTWGYWIRSEGDDPHFSGAEFEVGAFVDGPEIAADNPPTLPSTGEATYAGEAQWVFHHEYLEGDQYAGVVEIGQGVGDMTATVDFANSSLSACISCGDTKSRVYGNAVSPDGSFYFFSDIETDYQFEATATINPDGSFQTFAVTLSNSENPILTQEGSLAGRFSNILIDGVPRAILGTHGGVYTHETAFGSWVGTFGLPLQQ